MTDLDRRLRADAARRATDEARPPELSRALDAALGRRVAPATGWLAAAAAVVLLVAAAVVLAVRSGAHDGSAPASVPSISGAPLHRGALVLTRVVDTGVDTAFLVPGDPRALDVLVPYSRQTDGCMLYRPHVDVVSQSDTRVRLRASGYEYASKPDKNGNSGYSCGVDKTRPVRVRLDAPLGHRALYGYESRAGKVRVIDPNDAPRPSYLPPGYSAFQQTLPSARSGQPTAERIYIRDGSTITVDTGDASSDLPQMEGPVTGYTVVAGARASVIDHGDVRCVSWKAGGGQAREVCSDGPVLVSRAEVLKVARSLG